jgi:hypothetical protein
VFWGIVLNPARLPVPPHPQNVKTPRKQRKTFHYRGLGILQVVQSCVKVCSPSAGEWAEKLEKAGESWAQSARAPRLFPYFFLCGVDVL